MTRPAFQRGPVIIFEHLKEALIPLACGRYTRVSMEDVELVRVKNWHFMTIGYVARNKTKGEREHGSRIMYLHSEITGQKMIDHINGDKLDNRRQNLRLATKAQNSFNSGAKKQSSSGIRNVHRARSKWVVQFYIGNRKILGGRFDSLADAEKRRNELAAELHGEFAWKG